MNEVRHTRDIDEVRDWIEEYDGKPSHLEDEPRRLAVDFGDRESVKSIPWKEFFDIFIGENLIMVYEDGYIAKSNGRETREKYEFIQDTRGNSVRIPDTEIDDETVKQNTKETAV